MDAQIIRPIHAPSLKERLERFTLLNEVIKTIAQGVRIKMLNVETISIMAHCRHDVRDLFHVAEGDDRLRKDMREDDAMKFRSNHKVECLHL